MSGRRRSLHTTSRCAAGVALDQVGENGNNHGPAHRFGTTLEDLYAHSWRRIPTTSWIWIPKDVSLGDLGFLPANMRFTCLGIKPGESRGTEIRRHLAAPLRKWCGERRWIREEGGFPVVSGEEAATSEEKGRLRRSGWIPAIFWWKRT